MPEHKINLKTMCVLVSATSFGKSDPGLIRDLESQVGSVIYNETGKPLKSADLARMLDGVDGFIAGVDVIDRAALEHASRLMVIARYGVGVDNVDLTYARERGIVVTNTPGANSVSVAEMAITLMLNLARPIPEAIAATRQGNWPRSNGWSLEGKTVGLLGFGAIGRAAALRLRAFGCRVLAYDPYPDRAFAERTGVELAGMDAILPQCDFVSLHLPLLPETRGLVNAQFLSKMKAGSYLVNTARGELVNDADLADAIRSRRLAGAGLDVFAVEPPPADNPLLGLPQVIVTPHMAAHTDGAMNNMGRMALENCLAVLRNDKPANPVA